MTENESALSPQHTTQNSPQPLHIDYLDGVRGVAALYVLLFHIYQLSAFSAVHRFWWLGYGHYAVDIFIVLSGYSLMIAVVRDKDKQLRGGLGHYLRRRSRRILPPYYYAYGFSMAIAAVARTSKHQLGIGQNSTGAFDPFSLDNILSHLFLVHNLRLDWASVPNTPLWSIATEWQIYFFFPFLLLPLWRRFGAICAIFCGTILGLCIYWLFPATWFGCPWYLGLFAMGMGASAVSFSSDPVYQRYRTRIPWRILMSLLALIFLVLLATHLGGLNVGVIDLPNPWAADLLVGSLAACTLIHLTQSIGDKTPSWGLRFFKLRGLLAVGKFSYSLYLVHWPIVTKLNALLLSRPLTPVAREVALWGAGLPLCLLAAYIFYLLCERPFVTTPGRPSWSWRHLSRQEETT